MRECKPGRKVTGRRGAAGAEESFVPIATGATGAQSTPITNWIDYERENVFNEVRQTIGDVEIKGRIIDNARGIDLNRLFDLAAAIRERASTGVAGGALPGVSEEDLVGAVAGATDDAAAQRNLERIARGGNRRDGERHIADQHFPDGRRAGRARGARCCGRR